MRSACLDYILCPFVIAVFVLGNSYQANCMSEDTSLGSYHVDDRKKKVVNSIAKELCSLGKITVLMESHCSFDPRCTVTPGREGALSQTGH